MLSTQLMRESSNSRAYSDHVACFYHSICISQFQTYGLLTNSSPRGSNKINFVFFWPKLIENTISPNQFLLFNALRKWQKFQLTILLKLCRFFFVTICQRISHEWKHAVFWEVKIHHFESSLNGLQCSAALSIMKRREKIAQYFARSSMHHTFI